MPRIFICCWIFAGLAQAQKFPLEGVTLTGTKIPEAVVMEIAGLANGMAIDKAAIEQACAKLGDSGLFESVQYQYKPGPKHGYLVSLALPDRRRLLQGTIDVPGVEEDGVWKWIAARYPALDRKVPEAGAAEEFLAHEIERHVAAELHGHHVVSQMETDFGTGGGSLVSFHLDVMPQISELKFSGAQEVSERELREMMMRVTGPDGYMERQFRRKVELNLRGLYEQHGMYRVKFSGVAMARAGEDAVAVTTSIEEGPQYTLGAVQFTGEGLPVKDMETAAKFKTGKVANWREIDLGLLDAARVVRNLGYLDVADKPERVFDDAAHVLALRVPVNRGPLYHIGQVSFRGLTPEQEAKARSAWRTPNGAAMESRYLTEFAQAFGKAVDLRQFKKQTVNSKKVPGNVVDLEFVYTPN